MITLAYGEFIGALFVAGFVGGVLASIWVARDVDAANREVGRVAREHYSRGCAATRASLRDALTTLHRLHCSRSAAGHVRVADVERLLAEVRDE